VLAGTRAGPLAVYDADTGARLAVPEEVQPQLGFDNERLVPIADHAGMLLIADHQRVRTWDPRAGAWGADLPLEPALDDSRWLFDGRRAFCVLDRARALVFGSHAGIVVHDADSGVRLWSRRGARSSD